MGYKRCIRTMEWIKDILIIVLTGAIIFATVYFLMKQFFDNQEKLKRLELRKEYSKNISPQQMQAYERLILLMERIHPENMVMRLQQPGMNARNLQTQLLKSVRQEFEHNMAQQLYISSEAWALVKRSKEETVRLVNLAASQCKSDDEAMELSKNLLNMTTQLERLPTEVALEGIKKEFRSRFA